LKPYSVIRREIEPGMKKSFSIIDHTADIGIRARGKNLEEVFASAADGMVSLIIDRRRIRCLKTLTVEAEAEDQAMLLVEWLNQLLYLFDSQYFLCRRYRFIELNEKHLKVECLGEAVDRQRHKLKRGIKAATYHTVKVERMKDGYVAEVILDI
jgi:SHS2 domain-containing protein